MPCCHCSYSYCCVLLAMILAVLLLRLTCCVCVCCYAALMLVLTLLWRVLPLILGSAHPWVIHVIIWLDAYLSITSHCYCLLTCAVISSSSPGSLL
jgi:hypothetical protein